MLFIVPIGWLYVALMMAVAEANSSNGTLLGAVITFLLYGLGPVALVMYLMGAPMRRRAIRAKEAAQSGPAQTPEKSEDTSTATPNQPDAELETKSEAKT